MAPVTPGVRDAKRSAGESSERKAATKKAQSGLAVRGHT